MDIMTTLGLSEFIYRGLQNAEKGREKRAWMGLSELNYCIKRLYKQKYDMAKVKADKESLVTFAMGRDIEALVINSLKEGCEGRFEILGQEHFGEGDKTGQILLKLGGLNGHPDIVLYDTETAKYYLCEVKSAAQTSFNEMQKKGLKKAQPNHYMQTMAYMLALKDTYGIEVEYGIYLMVKKSGNPPTQRGNAMIYEEVVHWDREMEEVIRRKVAHIDSFDSLAEEPEAPYKTPAKECEMCPYNHVCPVMFNDTWEVE
jgi:hypothetical protein